jgi:type I restriction enzyme M protein
MTTAEVEAAMMEMSEDDYELMLMDFGGSTAKLKKNHYISYLFNRKNQDDFHKLFDDTLIDIANYNMEIFSVQTGGQSKIRLFEALSQYVIEQEKKDNFCRAIIDKLANCSFDKVFSQKYDFFATIFEYLIKDYNKDFGKYAEYYTPHAIASIIAKIMVPNKVQNVTVYDPAAGSGTLVLALAHEIGESNCTIYTQDISQKSNEFLRLNLILNNLVHSLPNVVHEDTLLNPRHLNERKDGLMTFDYIVSNPPFNMDFSDSRDTLAGEKYQKRFFAGVPNIPKKDKNGMAIYLMFLQHIIHSLDEKKGKAAVVVPTGFLTAASGIQKKIREHLVSKRMLKGVISMPSNIFATTGTNVSILFIDHENKDGKVVLMDASKLGKKVKEDGKNQKTVLNPKEISTIIDTFNSAKPVDDFCVVVEYKDIEDKKLSFSAGHYFDVKIEYSEITQEEFEEKMIGFKSRLESMFDEGKELEDEIKKVLRSLSYE